jgi:hypothetical protein
MEELQKAIFENLFYEEGTVWDYISKNGQAPAFKFDHLREAKMVGGNYFMVNGTSLRNIMGKLTNEELGAAFALCYIVESNDFNCLFSSKHNKMHTTKTLIEALGIDGDKFSAIAKSLIEHDVMYYIKGPSEGQECYILNPTLCQKRGFFHKSLIAHIKDLTEGRPRIGQTTVSNH